VPATVLILPGIYNAGPAHWQTRWEQSDPAFQRVQQRDWNHPMCTEWVAALDAAVERAGPTVTIVAHSLACLVVAHWVAHSVATTPRPVRGALLVAVPDSAGPNFPRDALGFEDTPAVRFPFPSTVVVSSDDPYGRADLSARLAAAWGSQLVPIGACGHINADSGLGDWPAGRDLLRQLMGSR